jgi:hypothetical protein
MSERIITAILLLGLVAPAASSPDGPAQEYLYLLSGTAANGANLPVTLYRLPARQSGDIEVVSRVADGMDCVLSDYERRRLVVASPALAPTDFHVIDMDAPSHAAAVRIPYRAEDQLPVGTYLLDLPQQGETIAVELAQRWKKEDQIPPHLVGNPLGSPGSSPRDLPLDDMGYVRTSGFVGGALPFPQNWVWMRGDPLRVVSAGAARGPATPHPAYLKDTESRDYLLVANNDSVTVLQGPPGTLDVLSKGSKEWRRVALPFLRSRVRAFGPWVAAIEAVLPAGGPSGSEVVADRAAKASAEASPGTIKRQAEEIGGKMTVDDLFRQQPDVFPGELLIYSTISGAMFRISTGGGDSEVLLVTDQAVYYRVDDQLFRSDLNAGGPGKPQMLASGEAIIQAHWAFLSSGGGQNPQ